MTLSDILQSRLEAVGAEAGALVHLETGVCLETIPGLGDILGTGKVARETLPLAGDANATAQLAREIMRMAGAAKGADAIEEIVATKGTKYEISQVLQTSVGTDLLLYLRFESAKVSLAMARRRLANFERQIELGGEEAECLQGLMAAFLQMEEMSAAEAAAEVAAPVGIATNVSTEVIDTPEEREVTLIAELTREITASYQAPEKEIAARNTIATAVATAPVAVASSGSKPSPLRSEEEKEFQQMNGDSVRWLKEMKKLLNWTRPFVELVRD